MIDAHCHLDFDTFDHDRVAVVARARDAGVEGLIVPGVSPTQWTRAATMRVEGLRVLRAVGWHPAHVPRDEPSEQGPEDEAALAAAAEELQAVAIGECGLDRRIESEVTLARQRKVLEAHLRVARERELPIVLHVVRRDAMALDVLSAFAPLRGMVHAFSGAPEVARAYLALGLHLSFGGAATRPNARRGRASAIIVPSDRLLVETDAPDQTPSGAPAGRNEPAFLAHIVAELASLRGVGAATLAEQTSANARALFGIC